MSGRVRTGVRVRPLRRRFRAMGTTSELRVWPEPGRERLAASSLAGAVAFLRRAEGRLSRFDARSELARLNRRAGAPVRVSRLTFAVVQSALAAAEATGGLFDPTVLRAMLTAGYDRSFERLQRQAGTEGATPSPTSSSQTTPHLPVARGARWETVRLDGARRTISLPPGVGLDLGGIAKGWLADWVLRVLERAGAASIDLGGDVALSGPPPGAMEWRLEVEDPRRPSGVIGVMRVREGGVATSGVTRRAWTAGGEARHHVIDPRTGRPATTDLLSVTVAAPAATAAEVAAKACLLLGGDAGRQALIGAGLAGVLVLATGELLTVSDDGLGAVFE